MLARQYQHCTENHPEVAAYLLSECGAHLSPPIGHSGVPVSQLAAGHLTSGVYPTMTARHTIELHRGVNNHVAGVYHLYNTVTGESYIGYSIGLVQRLSYHYSMSRDVNNTTMRGLFDLVHKLG